MRALRISIRRGDRGHEVVLGAQLGVWNGTAVIAYRNYMHTVFALLPDVYCRKKNAYKQLLSQL